MKAFIFYSALVLASLLSISSCGGGLCNANENCVNPYSPQLYDTFRHTAFVTSIRISGNAGGLQGADELCTKLAREGSVTAKHLGNWKAILSTDTSPAKARIVLKGATSIENTQGQTVVGEAKNLWKGQLQASIKFDQNGKEITEKLDVWTGTLSDGTTAQGPSLVTNCTEWTDGSTKDNGGVIGTAGALDQKWIQADDWIGCAKTDEKARVYCINSAD